MRTILGFSPFIHGFMMGLGIGLGFALMTWLTAKMNEVFHDPEES